MPSNSTRFDPCEGILEDFFLDVKRFTHLPQETDFGFVVLAVHGGHVRREIEHGAGMLRVISAREADQSGGSVS